MRRVDSPDDRRVAFDPRRADVGRLEWPPCDRASRQLVATHIGFIVAALTIEVNKQQLDAILPAAFDVVVHNHVPRAGHTNATPAASFAAGLAGVDGELLGAARGLVMMEHGDERSGRFSLPNS